MPSIRWNQDGYEPDAPDSGSVNLFGSVPQSSNPAPIVTPGKPVAVDPNPNPSSGSAFDAVSNFYQKDLGRAPENTDVVNNWLKGLSGNLSAIDTAIAGSPEGKAFAARPAQTTTSGGGDWFAPFAQALSSVQSTDDPNYWRTQIQNDPKVMAGDPSAIAYWQDRIRRGDGSALVKNGTLQKFQDGPNVSQFGYDDPSSMLFLSSVLNRLQQLQQPRSDPAEGQLAGLIQQLVARSQQAPYTEGQDAALTAHYMNPLTQARDAAIRQNTEQASMRGYLPSSGLLRRTNRDTQNAYIKAVGSASNNLGVQAVQEQQTRALQAIQALSGLVQNNRTTQDRADAIQNQIVELSQIFPNFDQNRLSMLLNASGDNSASSAISGLSSLGANGINASRLNLANSADSASAMGQLLGWIIEHMK